MTDSGISEFSSVKTNPFLNQSAQKTAVAPSKLPLQQLGGTEKRDSLMSGMLLPEISQRQPFGATPSHKSRSRLGDETLSNLGKQYPL